MPRLMSRWCKRPRRKTAGTDPLCMTPVWSARCRAKTLSATPGERWCDFATFSSDSPVRNRRRTCRPEVDLIFKERLDGAEWDTFGKQNSSTRTTALPNNRRSLLDTQSVLQTACTIAFRYCHSVRHMVLQTAARPIQVLDVRTWVSNQWTNEGMAHQVVVRSPSVYQENATKTPKGRKVFKDLCNLNVPEQRQ